MNRYLKFKVGDYVRYCGSDSRFVNSSGKVILTVNLRLLHKDAGDTRVLYPADGYDYAIQISRTENVPLILNVYESQIKKIRRPKTDSLRA